MAGSSSDEPKVSRSLEGILNGIASVSPPSLDTEDNDNDDDCGLGPSELYGKNTLKIERFSHFKRELRSNAFEVGGHKWYILIYPQGCDVYNHLSLFLCVADHDKLLPGWNHIAQFTMCLMNKDPMKSRYSDTLHRFWKKEHDWGWKKFMELAKVLNDGFVNDDTLIVKVQVQVIRERIDRPFRCLDNTYRMELVRVYMSNVEKICHQFMKQIREKLGNLIQDKVRWSSFCNFWLGIDQKSRHQLSRVKSNLLLTVVVKHFFTKKEATSTLVVDYLYIGLESLKSQTKSNKVKGKYDAEDLHLVKIESDTLTLVDDILTLLRKAVVEPLPLEDENGPQTRTQNGGSLKDITEKNERRLNELGLRTIEFIVLAYISRKIVAADQEALALKRQDELIREEEEEKSKAKAKLKRASGKGSRVKS